MLLQTAVNPLNPILIGVIICVLTFFNRSLTYCNQLYVNVMLLIYNYCVSLQLL